MRRVFGIATWAAVWACASGTGLAADGVHIVQRLTIDGASQTSDIWITTDRMRADIADPASGAKQAVVFDAARQVVDVINPDRKTYVEITKAQLDQLGAQAQDLMRSAMANMPPEQRAQMEVMMRGRGMGGMLAPAAPTVYHKVGTDHVGQWTCDTYEALRNGTKISDICTVPPGVLNLAPADLRTITQLADFFKAVAPQAAAMLEVGQGGDQGFSGVPVRTSTAAAGRQVSSEVTQVAREAFADSLFQVPEGFRQEQFMGTGGQGRR